jgi:hypothetical protein
MRAIDQQDKYELSMIDKMQDRDQIYIAPPAPNIIATS